MTPSAFLTATANGRCPGSSSGHGVVPDTTATGNCGTDFILVYNARQAGMTTYYGMRTGLGMMYYRDLYVSIYNWNSEWSGGWPDSGALWNTSYSNDVTGYAGVGYVTASLSGEVWIEDGSYDISCSLIPVSAGTQVTW
jgi:hypothetical protein